MLDMQHTLIDQQKELLTSSFDLHRRFLENAGAGMDAGRDAEERARRLTHTTLDASMDAVESAVPGETPVTDPVREMVEDQLSAGEELSEETWTAIESQLEESISAYGEFLDRSEELSLDLFETYLEAFDALDTTVDEAA